MPILFNEIDNTITLTTKNSSYQMKIDKYGYLLHTYYGAPIESDMSYLIRGFDRGFSGNPYVAGNDRTYSLDQLPLEYPVEGNGDFRLTALSVKEAGVSGLDLLYKTHRIEKGKYSLKGLPTVQDQETVTLSVVLEDKAKGVEVELKYSVIEDTDTITRAAIIKNVGEGEIILQNAASVSLDFLYGDFNLIHFQGRHAHEREKVVTPITYADFSIGSRRGTSSHQHNPFVIIADKETTEDTGSCTALMLLYSGSFAFRCAKDQYDQTRAVMGVLDERFDYSLLKGEEFVTPECAISFSLNGFSTLSHNSHKLVREHITHGPWALKRRPILINNWEATYFDFNKEKLIKIAKQAKELGVEMLVLDDGWFGHRWDDNRGLGDWFVNEEKLGGTLSSLVEEVNEMGLKFGLWIEPEMVNEDSLLYKEHPEFAFTLPGHKPIRSRNQLVLDFSQTKVVEYIFNMISKVIDSAHIEYIKMDMNRSLADVCSQDCSQGKVLYKYTLGVYDFLQRLLNRYPNLLIEGCSGGGGRFDAGMLYYTPQIWTSDNTDAIERTLIQYGTSFAYPISSMGSHVSAVPNHQTGRITPLNTRSVVAMAGSFGYELDLNKLSIEEKDEVKKQTDSFKELYEVIHNGLYYRLTDPTVNKEFVSYLNVTTDRKEALLSIVTLSTQGNPLNKYVRLKGLEENINYYNSFDKKVYKGSSLMHGGILLPYESGEYNAYQMHFKAVN